jgi:hypothetical protein
VLSHIQHLFLIHVLAFLLPLAGRRLLLHLFPIILLTVFLSSKVILGGWLLLDGLWAIDILLEVFLIIILFLLFLVLLVIFDVSYQWLLLSELFLDLFFGFLGSGRSDDGGCLLLGWSCRLLGNGCRSLGAAHVAARSLLHKCLAALLGIFQELL